MVKVNSYKTLLFPVVEARDESLLPEDIIKLTVKSLVLDEGQMGVEYVTSAGKTHSLVGQRMPTKINAFECVYVSIADVKRLRNLIGKSVAVRDARYPIFGGILTKVVHSPTTDFPGLIDKVNLKFVLDSDS